MFNIVITRGKVIYNDFLEPPEWDFAARTSSARLLIRPNSTWGDGWELSNRVDKSGALRVPGPGLPAITPRTGSRTAIGA
jgi:hypothetical protein